SGNDHPYGNVKPTLLFTLAARGTTSARSDVQHSSQNNGPGQHVVDIAVHAVDGILPSEEVVHKADQIDGERNQQVDPGCGVADHAVPEVWLLLAVMGNVRLWLSAGQPTGEAAPGANRSHKREPDPVAAVWAVGVEISLQMARENPESPNPDGNVQHTVIVLVLLALNNFLHSLGSLLDGLWMRSTDIVNALGNSSIRKDLASASIARHRRSVSCRDHLLHGFYYHLRLIKVDPV